MGRKFEKSKIVFLLTFKKSLFFNGIKLSPYGFNLSNWVRDLRYNSASDSRMCNDAYYVTKLAIGFAP